MAIKKGGATKELPQSENPYRPATQQSNPATQQTHSISKTETPFSESKKRNATRVTIHYDVGFQNSLYIRGKGANLSWEKGTPLKNISHDEWIWETEAPFTQCEFKVLINDHEFEEGENHFLTCGKSVHYTPHF